MIDRSRCRECQAGMQQALTARIGWTCSEHGTDTIDVEQMLRTINELRGTVAWVDPSRLTALEAENATLRATLAAFADRDNWWIAGTADVRGIPAWRFGTVPWDLASAALTPAQVKDD